MTRNSRCGNKLTSGKFKASADRKVRQKMCASMTDEEKREIQGRYYYLTIYGPDPDAPLDPLTYVDSNGDGLLHIAARLGDLRTVELLLKAGQDVNRRGDMGCTPLHYARGWGESDVAEFLLWKGADESIRNDFGRLANE
jgi:ankyrin repeat protein